MLSLSPDEWTAVLLSLRIAGVDGAPDERLDVAFAAQLRRVRAAGIFRGRASVHRASATTAGRWAAGG